MRATKTTDMIANGTAMEAFDASSDMWNQESNPLILHACESHTNKLTKESKVHSIYRGKSPSRHDHPLLWSNQCGSDPRQSRMILKGNPKDVQ